MKFAYIGTLNKGGTCLMRAETLQEILPEWQAVLIDVNKQFKCCNRLIQSVGFRFKRGPKIQWVNQYVRSKIEKHTAFDFIWVDKAIYLRPETTAYLKNKTRCLVHYTPDTAFYANRSRLFYKSLSYYDWVITTKSFEWQAYENLVSKEKVIFCTQGFNPDIHKPYFSYEEKQYDLVFIGLYEPEREQVIQHLINNNHVLALGGAGWKRFIKKNKFKKNLIYLGDSVRNEEYGRQLSKAKIGLGLLSRKFPELHTTRTFEIPACGTALLTEKNAETQRFFTSEEVLFYSSNNDLLIKTGEYLAKPQELKKITENGQKKVHSGGKSNKAILKHLLERIKIYKI